MLELTKEQHQAIQRNGDRPARVRDPETETTYVLLREDMYEQLKSRLDGDDFDPDEGLRLINEAMAEDDAGDPLLESYQKYRK